MKPNNYLDTHGKPRIGLNKNWVISEKYDGQRAIWTGTELISQNGNEILIPKWFRELLVISTHKLDGELYFGRGKWNMTGIFRSTTIDEEMWRRVRYIVFDIPDPDLNLQLLARLEKVGKTIEAMSAHCSSRLPIELVDNQPYISKLKLKERFDEVVKGGGEGLIMRNTRSFYVLGHTDQILKYKPLMDSEARIIGYKLGNGKFEGMLGSFQVEDVLNPKIKYGVSGLITSIRANYKKTHPIGTIITVKYTEKTSSGKPRYPRYKGIRTDIVIPKSEPEIAHVRIESPLPIVKPKKLKLILKKKLSIIS